MILFSLGIAIATHRISNALIRCLPTASTLGVGLCCWMLVFGTLIALTFRAGLA